MSDPEDEMGLDQRREDGDRITRYSICDEEGSTVLPRPMSRFCGNGADKLNIIVRSMLGTLAFARV